MNYFPFNRELVTNYVSAKGHLSITGQFITEVFKVATDETGEFVPDEITNPQLLRPDYLMRGRLEELNQSAFRHLAENEWKPDQIRNGLDVVRNYLWEYWKDFTNYYLEEDQTADDFNTGSQAGNKGPKSFRTWSNNSDPIFPLEYTPDDWFDSNEWNDKTPTSWHDIYALASLWSIDESISYLSSNDVFKAVVWQDRATTFNHFFTFKTTDPIPPEQTNPELMNSIAPLGGKATAQRWVPLKQYAKELAEEIISKGQWKSRRDTANKIAPKVIKRSLEIKLNMSESQAEFTLTKWLKEMSVKPDI